MQSGATRPDPSETALTTRQVRIGQLLSEKDVSLARLFLGAAELVVTGTNPGTPYFVLHAVREIINRLPDHYGAHKARPVTAEQLNELVIAWRRELSAHPGQQESRAETGAGGETPLIMTRRMYSCITEVVEAHEAATSMTQRDRARQFMEAAEIATGSPGDPRSEAAALAWFFIGKEAGAAVHVRTDGLVPSESEVSEAFERLEVHLLALLGEFYESMDEIDEILEEANQPSD